MPTPTTNFGFNKPLVNDPVDEDLWGGQLNDNWDQIDGILPVPAASKFGAIVVQSTDDASYEILSGQGTSGQPLISAGADALPAFGTLDIAGGGTGQTTASAAFDALKQSATTSSSGVVEQATQAEMEAETADKYPDAALLKNSPGVASAWVKFDGTGVVSIYDSYNVTSITDNSTGTYTVNFTNNMADTNYAVVVTAQAGDRTSAYTAYCDSMAVGSCVIHTQAASIGVADLDLISVVIYGDLA